MKDDGLTCLDVVKHACKTVMHMLTDKDRLALVCFYVEAEMVFPLGVMTEKGRAEALAALETLTPGGRTNIKGLRPPRRPKKKRQKQISNTYGF